MNHHEHTLAVKRTSILFRPISNFLFGLFVCTSADSQTTDPPSSPPPPFISSTLMPQTSPINAHTLDLTLDHPMNGCYGHPSAAGGCLRLLRCNANHTINNNHVHTTKHPIITVSAFKFTFHAPTHPNVSIFLRQHRNCGQSSSSNIKSYGLELGGPASHTLFVNRIARNKMTICISHNTFPRDITGFQCMELLGARTM